MSEPASIILITGVPYTGCGSGEYLMSLRDSDQKAKNVTILFQDYSEAEINAFKRVYEIEGDYSIASEKQMKFFDDIWRLDKRRIRRIGFCLKANKKGRIKSVRFF